MTAPSKSDKIKNYKIGLWAEWFAICVLVLKGYRILARRYKTKVGEIDVIARRGHLIAMIEVKYRRSVVDGIEAVTPRAQARIRRAADHYLLAHSCKSDTILTNYIRFDVIIVTPKLLIRHIKNAF